MLGHRIDFPDSNSIVAATAGSHVAQSIKDIFALKVCAKVKAKSIGQNLWRDARNQSRLPASSIILFGYNTFAIGLVYSLFGYLTGHCVNVFNHRLNALSLMSYSHLKSLPV